MSRIEGSAARSWPPLRISYADGRTDSRSVESVEEVVQPSEREQNLAAVLEQRLSTTLSQIRANVNASTSGAYANPRAASTGPGPGAQPGATLDILA